MDVSMLSVLLALLAVVVAITALYRLNAFQRTSELLLEDVRDLQRRLREGEDSNALALARLNYALKRQAGELVFTSDQTIEQIHAHDARARAVLASFHLGGCEHCAVDDNVTLAEAAASNSRDLTEILVALNALPEGEALVENRLPGMRIDPELRIIA